MKNKFLFPSALLLTCGILAATVCADSGNTFEQTAVSAESESTASITASPYSPSSNTAPEPAADDTEAPSVEPLEPIGSAEPSEPITPPVPNETAPSSFWSGYPEGTGSIENISEYWALNGCPDDVSFVADNGISTYYLETQTEVIDRLWTIGTVNMSAERKEEICALVAAGQHIQFVDAAYSYNRRVEMKNELESLYPQALVELQRDGQAIEVYLDKYGDEEEKREIEYAIKESFDSGIVCVYFDSPDVGIPETAIAEIGVEPSTAAEAVPVPWPASTATDGAANEEELSSVGTEPTVTILPLEKEGEENENEAGVDATGVDIGGETAVMSVEDNKAPDEEAYHEATTFQETLPQNEAAAIITNDAQKENNSLLLWICSAAVAAALIAAAAVIGKRHSALSLADGGEARRGGKRGKAETVRAVKESSVEPSEKAYEKIKDRIK